MSPDAEGAFDAQPLACHACRARHNAARAFQENGGEPAGTYFPVTRE